MIMTTEEKITMYEWMLAHINPIDCYICLLMSSYLRRIYPIDGLSVLTDQQFKQFFPELYVFKPDHRTRGLCWWPEEGIEKRIDVLNTILKRLYDLEEEEYK